MTQTAITRRALITGISAVALAAVYPTLVQARPLHGGVASGVTGGGGEGGDGGTIGGVVTVTLSIPSLGVTDSPLVAGTPNNGYVCKWNGASTQVEVEFMMHLDNPSSGVNHGDTPDGTIVNLGSESSPVDHSFKFYQDGVLASTVSLTQKQARTRFRWPWKTSGVVSGRTPAWLISNRFMLPYGDWGYALHTPSDVVYGGDGHAGPNSFCGIKRYEGAAGETEEIGMQNEWAGKFMMTGDATDILNIAEAAATAPVHYVDPGTGKPVSKITYPQANDYGGGAGLHGHPWLEFADADFASDSVVIYLSSAHGPDLVYLATLITNDPYHLKTLQHWANRILLTDGFSQDNFDGTFGPCICIGQRETRAAAWDWRTIAMAKVATKFFEDQGILPADCLPSSYFQTMMDNISTYYFPGRLADADPIFADIRVLEADNSVAPWENDYVLNAMAFIVYTGQFTAWNDVYVYLLKNCVDRSSGDSGWPACMPGPYFIDIGAPGSRILGWDNRFSNFGATQVGTLITSGELSAMNADQYNGGAAIRDDLWDYNFGAHSVLAGALFLHDAGIVDVLTPYPNLPKAFANVRRMCQTKETAAAMIFGHGGWFMTHKESTWFDTTHYAGGTFTPGSYPDPL